MYTYGWVVVHENTFQAWGRTFVWERKHEALRAVKWHGYGKVRRVKISTVRKKRA